MVVRDGVVIFLVNGAPTVSHSEIKIELLQIGIEILDRRLLGYLNHMVTDGRQFFIVLMALPGAHVDRPYIRRR